MRFACLWLFVCGSLFCGCLFVVCLFLVVCGSLVCGRLFVVRLFVVVRLWFACLGLFVFLQVILGFVLGSDYSCGDVFV